MSLTPSIYAHSIVALGYAAFAPILVFRGARSWLTALFALAVAATAFWATSVVFIDLVNWPGWTTELASSLRDGLWFAVVLGIIYQDARNQTVWRVLAATSAGIVLISAFFAITDFDAGVLLGIKLDSNATALATIIVGFVLIENMLRNISKDQFWSAKFLGIGLACILSLQLLIRIPEFLTHTASDSLLIAQPFVFLLALPLFVVTAVRTPALQLRVHSSRKFVFHTASLIGMGVLIEGTALAAYFVRTYGGDNGTVLSIVLGGAGAMGIAIAATSASVRSSIRTFINENFFSYKYDYRLEWSKFIRSLSASDEGSVPLKALRTLAEVVDSPGGALWILRQNSRQFMPVANWSLHTELAPIEPADPCLGAFGDPGCTYLELKASGENSPATIWHAKFPAAWLAVPLRYRGELVGVALINRPRAERKLDWEDRNLISLVALQLAAYVVQEETVQTLADARQLKEFNERFAFILHDIKNTVGQLKLLVRNVEQFGSDAEFRKDMVLTLRNSVDKLQELLSRLRGEDTKKPSVGRVDVSALISRIVADKRQLGWNIALNTNTSPIMTDIRDQEALLRVVEHVVTNAIEASPAGSAVNIGVATNDNAVQVTIKDEGEGMTQDFIANELFRPLRTTKSGGFGIGAYQAREIMHNLGGDINVLSKVGEGTTVTLVFPLSTTTPEGASV